jgi:hypothetical protein
VQSNTLLSRSANPARPTWPSAKPTSFRAWLDLLGKVSFRLVLPNSSKKFIKATPRAAPQPATARAGLRPSAPTRHGTAGEDIQQQTGRQPDALRADEHEPVVSRLGEPLQVPAQFRRDLLRERDPTAPGLRRAQPDGVTEDHTPNHCSAP